MNEIILVGAGVFLGAPSRYLISKMINKYWLNSFPMATFIVNVIGSFLLGLFIGSPEIIKPMPVLINYGLGIGFLGSFTTFSTFGFEVLRLVEDKKIMVAGLYVFLSFAMGFSLAWAACFIISA